MPESFVDRVLARIAELGTTPEAMSKKAGLNRNYLSGVIGKPQTANPKLDVILALATALETDPGWLAFGARTAMHGPTETNLDKPYERVPLLGLAGNGESPRPLTLQESPQRWVDRPTHLIGNALLYSLEVDTDLLSPLFEPGDWVLVQPGRALVPGEPCVIITPDNFALFKIFVRRESALVITKTLTIPREVSYEITRGMRIEKVLTYKQLLGG